MRVRTPNQPASNNPGRRSRASFNHRCFGASFAHYEATIMLGTLLRELEFELLDEQARWGRGTLILEPLDGIRVRVHRRGLLRSAA